MNDAGASARESTPRHAGKWRGRAAKLAMVGASVLVALVIGEVLIRLLPRDWVPALLTYEAVEFHLSKDLVRPSHNPNLYYELIPNRPENDVNREGYRGPLYPIEKPPGVVRIVGIGDSNMFAWQLPEEQGYLRQLERLWNGESDKGTRRQGDKERLRNADVSTKQSPPLLVSPSPRPESPSSLPPGSPALRPRLEVINLAVPGYNAAEHLEVLRSRALTYTPDLIILGYDHNDSEPIASDRQRHYLMPDDYGDNLLGSQLIRWAWRSWWMVRMRLRVSDPGGNRTTPPMLSRTPAYYCGGPLWDRHLAHHREMAERLIAPRRQEQALAAEPRPPVPVLVFIHDPWISADFDRQSRHYRELHEPLLAEFARLGWHVVDGYDLFQKFMARERQRDLSQLWISIHPRDGHPNARAHRLIAEALYEAIRSESLLPTGDGGE